MRALPWCSIVAVIVSTGACSYSPGVGSLVDGTAMPDDGPRPGAACGWTFSPRHVGDPCAATENPELVLTTGLWTYDTDTGALTDPAAAMSMPASTVVDGDIDVRVLAVASLTIQQGAELIVRGGAALALVVNDRATIDGAIDVSASIATLPTTTVTPGPGGNASSCADRRGQPGMSVSPASGDGGGGGGGGGFGTAGGAGASGAGGATPATGGDGGSASLEDFALRGGCGGGDGGISNSVKGVPGAGGGILLLAVKGATAVQTGAQLRSGGSGAIGGGINSGGPGGGSGGMIAIQTSNLALAGLLCANGGGGAGGIGDTVRVAPGESAKCSTTEAAIGGDGVNEDDGGNGGVGTTPPGNGGVRANDNDGGGGGGGSVGRIYLRAAALTDSSVHSPAPIVLPFEGF